MPRRPSIQPTLFIILAVLFVSSHVFISNSSTRPSPRFHPVIRQAVVRKVVSAESGDGLTFTPDNRLSVSGASSPSALVAADGSTRVLFDDEASSTSGLGAVQSTDGGNTFSALNITVSGVSGAGLSDPTAVRLKDGRTRLYFLVGSSDPSQGSKLSSAVSNDGVNFLAEREVFSYSGLEHPTLFKGRKEWLLIGYSTRDAASVLAQSRDGLNFKFVKLLDFGSASVGAVVRLSDGRFRLFAVDRGDFQGVVGFTSPDGFTWTREAGERLKASAGTRISGASVVQLPSGAWRMFYAVEETTVSGGKYYLAFHACDSATASCNDPRNHKVYLAESSDGAAWSIVPGWQVYSGSVPDVIRRGDTLLIYSVPAKVAKYHISTRTLDPPVDVVVDGLGPFGYVDPSPILDDQGRFALFFLAGREGGDPASCLPGESSCVKNFGSATEVPGSDGTRFTLDAGNRAVVTLTASGNPRSASDPDIFFDGKRFVLYISHGPSTSAWTSSDLRGSYAKILDLSNGTGGIASGHFDSASGKYWTFSHIGRNGISVIRRAVHADFSRQLTEGDWTTVLTGPAVGLTATTNVESPGFAF